MRRRKSCFSALFILLTGILPIASVTAQSEPPKYEFRGAWIATVNNIDWPSQKGLPVDTQKIEFIRMLDLHKANGMNAIVMQIRPAADAFYPSPYEPWSEWLTGTQGKPPVPYYDPLAFMIEETHKRGMEFHAWLNPYRAVFNTATSSIAPTHISRMRPEWFLTYGDKRYFDPGVPEAQQFVTGIVRDVVSRYAVDAIHFDDYFYPYRITGKDFPDTASYRQYNRGLSLDDWRRSNVDSIIVQLYRAIRAENPTCRFGISPFGVWRNQDKDPRGSISKAGQTNYDDLYADILLWLQKGWIDYVVPQLYWEFGHANAPFESLLDWWSKNSYGKPCYIGLGYYRAGSNPAWRDKTLIPRQLEAIRKTPHVSGAVYFSSKTFFRNPYGWNDTLKQNFHRYPALVPKTPGITGVIPAPPVIQNLSITENRTLRFDVAARTGHQQGVRQVALYVANDKDGGMASARLTELKPYAGIVPFTVDCPADAAYLRLHVTYVNGASHESEAEGPAAPVLQFRKTEKGEWVAL